MIGYISGNILHTDNQLYTVQPRGLGIAYDVLVSNSLLQLDVTSVILYVHHHITEQDQKLFGFSSLEERSVFRSLLKVNGVGPKAAMGLLTLGVSKLISAIETEDTKMLATAPGIGPKAANKIIVELKGVLPSQIENTESSDTPLYKSFIPVVVESLTQMGYDRNSLQDLLDNLPDDVDSAESATIWCIRQLSV